MARGDVEDDGANCRNSEGRRFLQPHLQSTEFVEQADDNLYNFVILFITLYLIT